jgi:hypothetical protein
VGKEGDARLEVEAAGVTEKKGISLRGVRSTGPIKKAVALRKLFQNVALVLFNSPSLLDPFLGESHSPFGVIDHAVLELRIIESPCGLIPVTQRVWNGEDDLLLLLFVT